MPFIAALLDLTADLCHFPIYLSCPTQEHV